MYELCLREKGCSVFTADLYEYFDYRLLLPSMLLFIDRKLYLHTDFRRLYTTAMGKWVKDVEMSLIIFYHLLLFYSLIIVLVAVTKTTAYFCVLSMLVVIFISN